MTNNWHIQKVFGLTHSARAIYLETPEAASFAPKLEQVAVAAAPEAQTLDDTKYLAEESADNPEGAVWKLADRTAKQIDGIIPANLKTPAAKATLQKMGGPDAKGSGESVKNTISAAEPLEEWNKRKEFIATPGLPASVAQMVRAAGSPTEARLACDQFSVDYVKAESQVSAAKEIHTLREKTWEKIEQIGMLSVEQKQISRFEGAKKEFALNKVNSLFPENPKLDQENIKQQRSLASTYLEGLLANEDLKVDKKEMESAMRDAYEKAGGDKKTKQFVEGLTSETPSSSWGANKENEFYKSASPEVKAYMEGMLDSYATVDEDGVSKIDPQALLQIQTSYLNIPEGQNSLSEIKNTLGPLKLQVNFEKERSRYIDAKILELFPNDPKDQSLDLKRENARTYLQGLFSSVSIHTDKEDFRSTMDNYYSMYSPAIIRVFIEGVMDEDKMVPTVANEARFSNMFAQTSPDVHMFLEGIINSFAYKHNDGKIYCDDEQANWVVGKFNSISVDSRRDIVTVKSYYSNFQARMMKDMDDTDEPEMKSAREVLFLNKPEINHFLKTRITQAEKMFLGKPGGQDMVDRYRDMLLLSLKAAVSVGKQIDVKALNAIPAADNFEKGTEKPKEVSPNLAAAGAVAVAANAPKRVNMNILNALPMPVNFERGTEILKEAPPDLVEAINVPKLVETYATNLVAKMKAVDDKPLVIKLNYDEKLAYYITDPPVTISVLPPSQTA